MSIGERLKKLRLQRKMKVSECAEFLEVSLSTYREWENGRAITGEPYPKLAKLFGVSISDLFGLEPEVITEKLNEIERVSNELMFHVKNLKSRL